jgi:hypothetical protein
MEHLYSLISLVLGIIFFILTYFFYKKDIVNKNQSDCNDRNQWSKDSCTVWSNNTCYKAKITDNGTTCTKSSDWGPLICGFLSIIAFVAALALYFYYNK